MNPFYMPSNQGSETQVVLYEEAQALLAEKDAEIAELQTENDRADESESEMARQLVHCEEQLRASNEALVAAEAMLERAKLLEKAVRADRVGCVHVTDVTSVMGNGWGKREYVSVQRALNIMDTITDNLTALRQHDKELLEKAAAWFEEREFVSVIGHYDITGYAEDELRRMADELD